MQKKWLTRCHRMLVGCLLFPIIGQPIVLAQELEQHVVVEEAPAQTDVPTQEEQATPAVEEQDAPIIQPTAVEEAPAVADPIAAGHLRFHFAALPSDKADDFGLWLWGDVANPSQGWPGGAINFGTAKRDDYGYYLDVKLKDGNLNQVGFLINSTKGENKSPNLYLDFISPDVNEVWVDANHNIHLYRPLDKGTLRINYKRTDNNYADLGVWLWNDVQMKMGTWPDGADLTQDGQYGKYLDVPLTDNASKVGFLFVNEKTEEKTRDGDYNFNDVANHTQIFVRDNDPKIYTNPYFVDPVRLERAEQVSDNQITTRFSTLVDVDPSQVVLTVTDKDGKDVTITETSVLPNESSVVLTGEFPIANAPYTVTFHGKSVTAVRSWRWTDAHYAYDGALGARLKDGGTSVDVTVWSPSAQEVNLVIYSKDNQDTIVTKLPMQRDDRGAWHVNATAAQIGVDSLIGYYYQFEIKRDNQLFLTLDPYAKSLGIWNDATATVPAGYASGAVAKAAFVDTTAIGPELNYANIPGYTKREDAVIYEVHVRDFTSDPSLRLTSQFGTFDAFIEKLDYLKSLGVTHVQLLPVMSYYYANEHDNATPLREYDSQDVNYNWGYDPQSYFSLTGMYSTNPSDPTARIAEFKRLINEIHKRDMGVILDVVYNHTAKMHILEDLEPNYYHWVGENGLPRESYGGGRVGTTRHMSRRLIVDSIKYWTQEFKVDGFRFDMMGDHDAQAVQMAYDEAVKLNPNVLMIGEGWLTFVGDAGNRVQPADQSWMNKTVAAAVFSDEIRNELKSGFGHEGEPRFVTGGPREVWNIFNIIKGQPRNFDADQPGDVVQYVAAHDNLTLHDVIAQSIRKDPKDHEAEIQQRIRVANTLVLTSQGIAFIHAGQEYGRTKQFRHPDFINAVDEQNKPYKSAFLTDWDGIPFDYPYFIDDSYDSSDAINQFDWAAATNKETHPLQTKTQAYTTGLIAIRRSTDAFRLGSRDLVNQNVQLISVPGEVTIENDIRVGVAEHDLLVAYQATATNGDRYAVFVNADEHKRRINFGEQFKHLADGVVIADANTAGTTAIAQPAGVTRDDKGIVIEPLTTVIIRLRAAGEPEVPQANTWKPEGDTWSYTDNNGQRVTGWQWIGESWYHFNDAGLAAKGWQWIGDSWFYFESNAAMVSGWHRIDNTWFFFEDSGRMKTGWLNQQDKWYYLNEGGQLAANKWVQADNNTWYYINGEGVMVAHSWQQIAGTWYYFNADGTMRRGWVLYGEKWYYLDDNGAMVSNRQVRIDGRTYTFNADGTMR